jgi:hypothetical protein
VSRRKQPINKEVSRKAQGPLSVKEKDTWTIQEKASILEDWTRDTEFFDGSKTGINND